jgi:hypothetical protein
MGNIIWLMFCCLFLSGLSYVVIYVLLLSTKPKRDFKELSNKLLENYNKETLDIYLLIQEGKNDEALEGLIEYVAKEK